MPIVSKTIANVAITNDPNEATTAYVDLPLELSQKYGKLIRQGHSVKITGIQARLKPTSAGYDVGMSVVGSMGFTPVTRHSRKAWNEAFRFWTKQKSLASAVGPSVNSDDLEYAFDAEGTDSRTSLIYSQGMGDSISAKMVLQGASTETGLGTQIFSLEDFYNSNHPVTAPSKKHWDNSVWKAKKYDHFYPDPQYVWFNANLSTMVADNPTTTSVMDDALGGSLATTEIQTFPEPVNALCGVVKFTMYVVPDDTDTQNAGDDTATLDIVFYISSWKPLVYKARKKRFKRSMYRSRRRRVANGRRRRRR